MSFLNFAVMDNKTIQCLHEDHVSWSSEIRFYNSEIKFLKKILHNIDKKIIEEHKDSKIQKYLNHLDHNLRFLKEIQETIDTHEMFMKDNVHTHEEVAIPVESLDEYSDMEFVDHEKTKKHIKEFRKRYNKLKTKIFRISEHTILDKA